MWRVHGGWILMLALLKIPTLRKVKEILILELTRMLRAVTRNRTKQNHRHLKAIVMKYNMMINGLLCPALETAMAMIQTCHDTN